MIAFIFDTEINGLVYSGLKPLDEQPEIIEFYGVLVEFIDGKPIQRNQLNYLFKPAKPLPAEITKITGLTDQDLAHAPRFIELANVIQTYIEMAPLVIAHNAAFDKEMVDLEFKRLGQKLAWPRILCTVEQTIHLKGYRLSLSDLHLLLTGEKFSDAHRAGPDTEALIRCCGKLIERNML